MERIRSELAQEALQPRIPNSRNSVISISSDSSAASSKETAAYATKRPNHQTIIIDSDDDDDVQEDEIRELSLHAAPIGVTGPPDSRNNVSVDSHLQQGTGPLRPATNAPFVLGPSKPNIPFPIPIPANASSRKTPSADAGNEWFDEPNTQPYEWEARKTAAEAEKDLKELFEGGIQDGLDDINMEDAIVPGFKDGIVLKPHQVKGRIWMKERETGKKAGGLLCDDMGLGKTIQTVTRIVDGPPSKEDRKNGWSRTTLVVCPVALVKQWAEEIKKYTGGTLRVLEHHGPSRSTNPDVLAQVHVVITSYSVAASEFAAWRDDSKNESANKKRATTDSESDSDLSGGSSNFGKTLRKKRATKKTKNFSALFRVQWWRVVLDEAHNIKNKNTKQAQACCELRAKFRWAITGTPIQNSVEDIYSLLKFLRIRPLNDWSHFNETIAKPVKAGRSGRAMKRLHVVMKAIMLRRQKDSTSDGLPLITLPPRTVEVVECDFDEDERAFYNALEEKTSLTFNKFIKRGSAMRNYTQVLILLLRLRQACNHPSLVSKDFHQDAAALEPTLTDRGKLPDDEANDDALADLFQKMAVNTVKQCDVCQTELDTSKTRCEDCEYRLAIEARRKSARPGSALPPSSAKLRKILELLETIDERSDGMEKTIIFSQFTGMLDLVQPFLQEAGIHYVRYDGSMNPKQRQASLDAIRENKSTRVILISFKAGGSGLNLTACNNVILVDLWWNPALEEQAFGRVHRYGQERDVMIYKLTIDQTIEQRILALQDRKRNLADAALSGDKLKLNKLGEDELIELFRRGSVQDSEDESDH